MQGSEIERAYFWVLEDVVEYFNRAENPEGKGHQQTDCYPKVKPVNNIIIILLKSHFKF